MGLDVLVYSPLLECEGENFTGWDKSTIDYMNNNRELVKKIIKGYARGRGKKFAGDMYIDEIYSDILLYMYKCEDYNLQKAIELSTSGKPIPLEGYVRSCIKNCVYRYTDIENKTTFKNLYDNLNEYGESIDVVDNISDDAYIDDLDSVLVDLEQTCKSSEHLRYKFGPDLYLIWYIRLMTINKGLHDIYNEILEVLGISSGDLENMRRDKTEDEVMRTFAKGVSQLGLVESIEVFEKYIYSTHSIKNLLDYYKNNNKNPSISY